MTFEDEECLSEDEDQAQNGGEHGDKGETLQEGGSDLNEPGDLKALHDHTAEAKS